MERKDFLLREIEKLTKLLKKLIGLIEDINPSTFEEGIEEINTELTNQFGFNLIEISKKSESKFLQKIEDIDEQNLEFLTELLSIISKKMISFKKENNGNAKELAKKAILLLDYIDKISKTFSFNRMAQKTELQKTIANY